MIDTSSNYTDGNSELLIGAALKDPAESGKLPRESVVVVTKGGYIQGENYEISKERKEDGYPYSEVLEIAKGFEHCIHPEFLREQITVSLERLNLETIDVYLLHNPEYYLKFAKKNNIDKEAAREEYYRRIKQAFQYLETEVEAGRINWYGISSNTFPKEPDDYDFTSLEKVIEIAEEVSKDNRFAVIEFPMNLLEKGAFTIKNQSNDRTLLESATEKNLGVLINRPLNAISGNKLVRFAEPVVFAAPKSEAVNLELKNIHVLEKTVSEKLKKITDEEIIFKITKSLFIFEELGKTWSEYQDIFEWETALNRNFLPRFHYYKNYIKSVNLKDEDIEQDLFALTFKVGKLFGIISTYYNNEYLKFTEKIKQELSSCIPESAKSKKLNNMTINMLRSVKGVSCILVGMVQTSYVLDIVEELKTPVAEDFNLEEIRIPFLF